MDADGLRMRLAQILAEEEDEKGVDWQAIESLSCGLLGELQVPVPLIADEYLRGSERRRQDMVFAHAQRCQLLLFLRDRGTAPS